MGKLKDKIDNSIFKKIINKLEDDIYFVRNAALSFFRESNLRIDDDIIRIIVRLLEDTNETVRFSALRTLLELDYKHMDREIFKKIIDRLKDNDKGVAEKAKEVLEKYEDKINNEILKEIEAINNKYSYSLLKVLYLHGKLED